jgi:hypothetical protein
MQLEWVEQGRSATRSLVFSWDNDIEQVKVWHISDGVSLPYTNNLVFYDGQNYVREFELPVPVMKGDEVDRTRRKVYPIINDGPYRAGLTIHQGRGSWSSLPHHFEVTDLCHPRPMPFYEKFAYVTIPAGGWAVQVRQGHLFDRDDMWWINDVMIMRDRDIADIPLGNHPVSAAPGYGLAYFWLYGGDLDRREKF